MAMVIDFMKYNIEYYVIVSDTVHDVPYYIKR